MPIIIAMVLGLAVLLIYAFTNIDKLVQIEYKKFKEEWTKDGKPRGFFWRSPECSWFASSIAMQKLSFTWIFKTPQWMRTDFEANNHLRRLRLFVLLFNNGIVVWFTIAMIIIRNPTFAWPQTSENKSAADIVWHETDQDKAERAIFLKQLLTGI